MKTEITNEDYHKLLGLMVLADSHKRDLDTIQEAAAEIVGEEDNGYGGHDHIEDEVWGGDINVERFLKRHEIKVTK